MWFVIKTRSGEESKVKSLLLSKVGRVVDVYAPIRRKPAKDKLGRQRFRAEPLIGGYLFADLNIAIPQQLHCLPGDKRWCACVWKQLGRNVTARGYFFYKDAATGRNVNMSGCRLLSDHPQDAVPEVFIAQSYIPDADMRRFMAYADDAAYEAEDVEIVGEQFDQLARLHDVVRIVSGPLAGLEGVVVQKMQGDGRRDRHLEVRLGNSFCVSYPNIRRFDMVVVREAVEGSGAWRTRLWRQADQLIGALQRQAGCADDAPARLSRMVERIRTARDATLATPVRLAAQAFPASDDDRRMLLDFAASIPINGGVKEAVRQYVPSYPIRAFITPAIQPGSGVATLRHSGFDEIVFPISIDFSGTGAVERGYEARVAALHDLGWVVAPWGGFYDCYEQLDASGRMAFLADLKQKNYKRAYSLLATGHISADASRCADAGDGAWADDEAGVGGFAIACDVADAAAADAMLAEAKISFKRVGTIGGFAMPIGSGAQAAALALARAIVPAAIELWQRPRLRFWRDLVQHYVLLRRPTSR